jgi:hypothetical protein
LRHRRSGDGLGLRVDADVQLDAARSVFAERGSGASLEEIAPCRGLAAEAMIMLFDENGCGTSNACEPALATEDAPDRVALADHQFALMMDGVYAPASTRP